MNTNRTSQMTHPLEVPNGWFLAECRHRHLLEGSHYVPEQLSEGAWYVTFQATITPLRTRTGTGHTLEQAWGAAVNAVAEFEEYHSNGE